MVVGILLLLWLLHGCRIERRPFDYFRAKAEHLDRDPERIRGYVAGLETLPYRGDLKGPLGTLFEEAGSADEKAALLAALLAHPEGHAPAPASEREVFEAKVVHLALRDGGPPSETFVFAGPVGSLVGDVHSVSYPDAGRTRVEIRAGARAVESTIDTAGAAGEALRFEIEVPGLSSPRVVVRELWRRDDRTGPRAGAPGDRHDFVVLPCRIGRYVRRQEGVVLAQRGRAGAPEMIAYDALLEYALRADELLAEVERRLDVRATFDRPRILFLSRRRTPEEGPVTSFDLRLDETSFTGDPADARLAGAVRSLLASAYEHAFLGQWMPLPGLSAFDLCARLSSGLPRTRGERTDAIQATLETVRGLGPATHARFGLRGATPPDLVRATWSEGRTALEGGGLAGSTGDLAGAAAAIEDALVAGAAGPFAHSRLLDVSIDPGAEPIVVPHSRLEHRFERGGVPVEQQVTIASIEPDLEYSYITRRGLRAARGAVIVEAAALEDATVHDPQYPGGIERRERATSLCLSRRVFAALRRGEETPFRMLGPRGPRDDPRADRPVVWSGRLVPDGDGRHATTVNGRPEEVPILFARAQGEDPPFERLAILADPRFPVGIADGLVSITTSIRGRLVDEEGLPIGGAIVELPAPPDGDGRASSVFTWPDGRFRLPPLRDGVDPARVPLVVRQKLGDEESEEGVEVDLTAPGLEDVVVRARRLRVDLVWIAPDQIAALEALPVSDQMMRHARRALEDGWHVVIPSRMLPAVGGAGGREIACYAVATTTGEVRGVLEEGIHGVTVLPAAGGAGSQLDLSGPPPAYVVPREEGLAWGFSAERLERFRPEETWTFVRDGLADWDRRTNLFAAAPTLGAAEARVAVRALDPADPGSPAILLRAAHAFALDVLDHLIPEE